MRLPSGRLSLSSCGTARTVQLMSSSPCAETTESEGASPAQARADGKAGEDCATADTGVVSASDLRETAPTAVSAEATKPDADTPVVKETNHSDSGPPAPAVATLDVSTIQQDEEVHFTPSKPSKTLGPFMLRPPKTKFEHAMHRLIEIERSQPPEWRLAWELSAEDASRFARIYKLPDSQCVAAVKVEAADSDVLKETLRERVGIRTMSSLIRSANGAGYKRRKVSGVIYFIKKRNYERRRKLCTSDVHPRRAAKRTSVRSGLATSESPTASESAARVKRRRFTVVGGAPRSLSPAPGVELTVANPVCRSASAPPVVDSCAFPSDRAVTFHRGGQRFSCERALLGIGHARKSSSGNQASHQDHGTPSTNNVAELRRPVATPPAMTPMPCGTSLHQHVVEQESRHTLSNSLFDDDCEHGAVAGLAETSSLRKIWSIQLGRSQQHPEIESTASPPVFQFEVSRETRSSMDESNIVCVRGQYEIKHPGGAFVSCIVSPRQRLQINIGGPQYRHAHRRASTSHHKRSPRGSAHETRLSRCHNRGNQFAPRTPPRCARVLHAGR